MRGLAGVAFRTIGSGLSRRCQTPYSVRSLSAAAPSGMGVDNGTHNSSEFIENKSQRMFDNTSSGPYYNKLDKIQKSRQTPGSHAMNALDESLSTLTDGMDGKLMKKAMYFDVDIDELNQEDYSFRPDMSFYGQKTYETKDLDLTKPGVRKPFKRNEFKVTTEKVLRSADFRNVKFLANFITEAGILDKRSKTGISAKAQRKVAREIKTARAFGLMPFTTMGTKSFAFGFTMETLDKDFEYQTLKDDMVDAEDEK